VKVAWLEAAAKLGMKAQAATILARLRTDSDAAVRVAALAALQALAVPELEAGVRAAMKDADDTVRIAAMSALPEMDLAAPAKVELLTAMIAAGAIPEQQTALRAIGDVPGPAAVDALSRIADDFAAGRLDPSLQLDLLEAMRATKAEPLLQRLDQMKVGRDLSALGTAMPGALAVGGSPVRGQQVVFRNEAAQCTRCHNIGAAKAEVVGPHLSGVAGRLTREQLLQSLIDPSARLAPGYGQVALTLKNGQKLQGLLREETETTIGVDEGKGGVQRVPASDVASRVNGVSAMPDMDLLLTPRQIRDVVAYLMTLRK
jgi:putative heme-binding domain-containing protein